MAAPGRFLFLLVLSSAFFLARCEEVVGCEGFVQASPALVKLRSLTDPKLDYSDIQVELLNDEGLVKDKQFCAPNGYYFFPLYEKGKFVISVKGPPGWTFEPEKVPVFMDESSCNGKELVNFAYTGFSLSGRITSAPGSDSCSSPDDKGPAGVSVTLTSVGSNGQSEVSVVSDVEGVYRFSGLPIGKYTVKASHPVWQISTVGSNQVEVNWGTTKVPDIFQVAGYDLQGSVLAQGNPVLGVQIFLYPTSPGSKPVPCQLDPVDPPQKDGGLPPLCHTVSGEDGKFVFHGLPCARYRLVPYYKGELTLFDVSPAEVVVDTGHGSTVLEAPFEVTGFSVGGKVVDSGGNGIPDVEIVIDGSVRSKTDSKGNYKLDQVTSGTYTISARKPLFVFNNLDKISVLPNVLSLPEIVATEYSVCGIVAVEDEKFARKRQVAITHGPEGVKPQSKLTNEDGTFCFSVPPGSYLLAPAVSPSEQSGGLLFSPDSLDVVVAHAPVTGVAFSQATLSISGKVRCKEFCPGSVKLKLKRVEEGGAEQEVASQKLPEDRQSFTFENVVPGNYVVEVQNEAPEPFAALGDTFCWEAPSLPVAVSRGNATGVAFSQAGWVMRINASHATHTSVVHDLVDPLEVDVKRGLQEVCLGAPGEHLLLFMDPCLFFGALMIPYHTDSPEPVSLVAQKFVVEGLIKVDSRLYPDASNLTDTIFPSYFSPGGPPIDQQSFATLKHAHNRTNPYAVYEYAYWASFGEEVVIRPRHNGRVQDRVFTQEDAEREAAEQQEKYGERSDGSFPVPPHHDSQSHDDVQRAASLSSSSKGAPGEAEGSLRELFEMQAISNPAVTGKIEDFEEIQKRQRRRMGLPEVEEGEPLVEEAESDGAAAEEEVELPPPDDEEEEEDPYEGVPSTARPFPDPEPQWPPLKRVLFYPRQQHFSVLVDGCQPLVPDFQGRLGVYLEGKIVPPLAGVNVTVKADTGSVTGGFQVGDEVLWTVSQSEGLYSAGPLYDDATYSVVASKEGYEFRPIDGLSFEGHRLAWIDVQIEIDGPDDASSPSPLPANHTLPGVLLSLSSDKGYRRNAQTKEGEGGLTFGGLFPGSFYLRPVLKEYRFEPAALSVDLGPGEGKTAVFRAKRVAFSVFGSVRSLSGGPQPGVAVQALSEAGGPYEGATTDESGAYRLRGLQPGTKYRVQVAPRAGDRVERAAPEAVLVELHSGDLTAVDFVAFDRPDSRSVTGAVVAPGLATWQPHLRVALVPSPADGPDRHPTAPVAASQPLPLSGFFEFHGLAPGRYSVQLRFGLSDRSHAFASQPSEADLSGGGAALHVGAMGFSVEERVESLDLATSAVLPIAFSLAVILLFASLSKLKDAYNWLIGGSSGSGTPRGEGSGGWYVPGDAKKKDVKRASLRKRTY